MDRRDKWTLVSTWARSPQLMADDRRTERLEGMNQDVA